MNFDDACKIEYKKVDADMTGTHEISISIIGDSVAECKMTLDQILEEHP